MSVPEHGDEAHSGSAVNGCAVIMLVFLLYIAIMVLLRIVIWLQTRLGMPGLWELLSDWKL